MVELVKWVWLIVLIVLFVGFDFLIILGICAVIFILVAWLKPEWMKRH